MTKFIVYTRVSTREQGRSKLGLEGQSISCLIYLNGLASLEDDAENPKTPLVPGQNPTDTLAQHSFVKATFCDIISGARNDRPQLMEAMKMARKTGATLLVSKLDRLSRDVEFVASLLKDRKLKIVVASSPSASKFQLHIVSAVAMEERQMTSERVKAALGAAKARGVKLGGPNLPAINDGQTRLADAHAAKVAPIALPMRKSGATLSAIASALTSAGVPTARGGVWSPTSVMRILNRLDKQAA